jgi:peptidylprolyl isomerase
MQPSRRAALQAAAAVVAATLTSRPSAALAESPRDSGAMTSTEGDKLLIDAAAEKDLEGKPRITTASGLEYQELVAGKGPTPTVGIQVTVNYVAKTPNGKIFDNSLAKGAPYYVRVGSGAVVPGLDEALLSMQTGSIRRLYIPGDLAFPKGLASAPGRPKVPPKSPVVFDVQLVYIPGISDDLEFE